MGRVGGEGGPITTLTLDAQDILMERVGSTRTEDINPGDSESELLNDNEIIESTEEGRVRGMMPFPPYA